jgi:Tfp pilus assembly protein PilF
VSPALRAHLTATRTVGWGVILTVAAAGLCFVPLFDLLSYEFSFAIGLVAAVGAAHLGVHAVARARAAGEAAAPVALFGRAAAVALTVLLGPPLVLISANALRVRVCDYPAGLAFYAALPVVSVLCATAVGVAAGLAVRRPGRATAAAELVMAGSVLIALAGFYAAPPIFAYDPFGGYFPGALYDEDLRVQAPLLWARLYHLTGAAALLALLTLLTDRHALRLRAGAARSRPRALAAALLLAAAAAALGAAGPALGFRQSGATIAAALGGRRETPHFVIVYPRTGEAARHIDQLAEDHEFRYAELTRTLGVQPAGRITSYVFASAAQKRALMGAAHVYIAKPWRREIYIQYERFPHPVLEHELAHVFAGAFGAPPFDVAMRWRGPYPQVSVGLIEGVAEAAAWRGAGRLTEHQWARALVDLKLAPPLGQVFGLGFLTDAASRSYTIAGSFCRFLLERYGAAPLARVYRGGGDFAAVYGKPLGALEAEWREVLRGVPLTPADLELARDRFQRPAIFHVPCAHTIAVRRQRAAALLRDGAPKEAAAELAAACRDDPQDPDGALDLAMAQEQAGDPAAARRTLEALLGRRLSGATRARALFVAASIALRAGDDAAARRLLAQVRDLPTDEGTARTTTALLRALDDPRLGPPLRAALVPPDPARADAAVALLRMREAMDAAPGEGLGPYLVGRQLFLRDHPAEALPYLERAAALPLPDDRFRRENQRLLGLCAYLAGARDRSRAVFTGLRDAADTPPGLRLEAEDMLRRIAFDATASGT